jgi:hypothetical protein
MPSLFQGMDEDGFEPILLAALFQNFSNAHTNSWTAFCVAFGIFVTAGLNGK